MRSTRLFFALILLGLATAAHADDSGAQADRVFATRCFVCHGQNGQGDGPAAAGLNPKPRNFHDKTWQAQVTDGEIETAIARGGLSVGKSAIMAANPDLTPGVIQALRAKIRFFGGN